MYLRIKINFNQILYAFEYSFLIFHFHAAPGVKKPLIFGSPPQRTNPQRRILCHFEREKKMFQPAAVDGEANPVSPEFTA